jgi:hypothetical protein
MRPLRARARAATSSTPRPIRTARPCVHRCGPGAPGRSPRGPIAASRPNGHIRGSAARIPPRASGLGGPPRTIRAAPGGSGPRSFRRERIGSRAARGRSGAGASGAERPRSFRRRCIGSRAAALVQAPPRWRPAAAAGALTWCARA